MSPPSPRIAQHRASAEPSSACAGALLLLSALSCPDLPTPLSRVSAAAHPPRAHVRRAFLVLVLVRVLVRVPMPVLVLVLALALALVLVLAAATWPHWCSPRSSRYSRCWGASLGPALVFSIWIGLVPLEPTFGFTFLANLLIHSKVVFAFKKHTRISKKTSPGRIF